MKKFLLVPTVISLFGLMALPVSAIAHDDHECDHHDTKMAYKSDHDKSCDGDKVVTPPVVVPVPGPVGPQGPAGPAGITTTIMVLDTPAATPDPAIAVCTSHRIVKITLPKGFHHPKKFVVNFTGFHRGIYAVVIRKHGQRPVKRLYSICGAGNLTGYNV